MPNNGNVSRVVTRNSAHSTTLSPWSVKVNGKSGHFAFVTLTSKHISNIISVFFSSFFLLLVLFCLNPSRRDSRKVLPSAPGSGRRGQRWSEVKVQDVSHRTGQGGGTHIGGGHGKVQRHGGEEREEEAVVTTKNDGEMWKGRRKGEATGEDVEKSEEDEGGFRRKMEAHGTKRKVKSRGGKCEGKWLFWGVGGQRGWVNSSKKNRTKIKKEWTHTLVV